MKRHYRRIQVTKIQFIVSQQFSAHISISLSSFNNSINEEIYSRFRDSVILVPYHVEVLKILLDSFMVIGFMLTVLGPVMGARGPR